MVRAVRAFLRLAAVAVPIGLGVLSISYAQSLKQGPSGEESARRSTPVRVVTLAPTWVVPRVVGHGTVQPARDWRAVARIEGEVIATAERLAPGEIVAAGTELLRLDDTDLRLSLAQIDAQFAALAVRDDTLEASLEIARADRDLSAAELSRQQSLADQGVATRSALDQARRQDLAARARVVETENQLALNAAERRVLEAQRRLAARSLDFTAVTAPYDMRLTGVSAEIGQVVTRGQVLATGEGTEAVEIAAQFAFGRLGPLVRMLDGAPVTELGAEVRLPVPGHGAVWTGDVVRLGEATEATTQSTALIVRVEDPLSQAAPGAKPPLRRNTYVEVVLSAPPLQGLAAPLEAVQGGMALVVGAEGTLERRPVDIRFAMDGVALIGSGLAEGDRLVVTDPAIAVPGMAVEPVEDAETAARVAALASGQPAGARAPGSGAFSGGGGGGQGKGASE
jgi:multidrug efflux pump subunit AcrA (membrane-fusion protein)